VAIINQSVAIIDPPVAIINQSVAIIDPSYRLIDKDARFQNKMISLKQF